MDAILIFFNSKGQGQIFLKDIFNYSIGDSIYINSTTDKFGIYRNESPYWNLLLVARRDIRWRGRRG
jgi:hypothetical protein